jgi:hypothetical protein
MALSKVVLQTKQVEFAGGEFVLHGLSLSDAISLVLQQKEEMEQVFDFAEANGLHLGNVDADVAAKLVTQLPDFAGRLIATAAHEPDAWGIARDLPAPVQFEALEAVARLTFRDAAGFRSFVGKVMAAVKSAQGALPSPTGEAG